LSRTESIKINKLNLFLNHSREKDVEKSINQFLLDKTITKRHFGRLVFPQPILGD